MERRNLYVFLILLLISISVPTSISQTCNGISMSYVYNPGEFAILPNVSDPTQQAFRFNSTLTILNGGINELNSWRVSVGGFKNRVLLVSASNALLADGTSLPVDISNGTVFAGFPATDLKSAIWTAGDFNQMQARVELVGTKFGVDVPLPTTLSLANDGYRCSDPVVIQGNILQVCCNEDPSIRSNVTLDAAFLPRQNGDLTIMYDVIRSYETSYWAQVTLSNHNPISRLDNWNLSWEWQSDEFINTMKGAYPNVVDANDCIYGRQGEFYQDDDHDFAKVLNCHKIPTIIDLPLEKTNDTNLGMIPFCCKNGTILPPSMDPSKSMSIFVMEVYKMPPNLNRTALIPPQNWNINGTQSSDYQCAPPVRVRPTLFPDPTGLPSESTSVASWQVVCNITQVKPEKPKCCVSFSAFYNDSVVPCNTCACGCNPNPSRVCSATTPALLLPSDALLIPFDNRTKKALDHFKLKDWDVPDPLPCGDNCGVSINWHLLSDFRDGWTARMTLFNWGETDIVDWFAAVQLDKAVPGFEAVYSFNGSVLPAPDGANTTLFLQGLDGLNYLVKERDADKPKKHPPVPGTQQTVISFKKKNTPGIDVVHGDGFPSKVLFNGEECSLPLILPSKTDHGVVAATGLSIFLAFLAFAFLEQHQ